MNGKNICKFVTEAPSDTISIHNFVLESDVKAMKNQQFLESNRIILVKEKNVIFTADGNEYMVPSGSIFIAFSSETLSANPDSGAEYMYISFSGSRSNSLFLRFGINKNSRVFSGFEGIIPLWHEGLSHANESNTDLTAESILLYTFARFTKEASGKSDLINQILKITEEEFTNPDLSIAEISERLSYNYKYLSHLFKEKMAVTYSEYLRNLRIKYAVSLLDHGIDSVKNIAYLSGFSDPLYFSSVFKKVIGVSPKEYKQS